MALCAFAGLRLGEAAALQAGDVDFLSREIHVRRQVQRAGHHQVEIRAPKYGSERTVFVPDGAAGDAGRHIRLHRPVTMPIAGCSPAHGAMPMRTRPGRRLWRNPHGGRCRLPAA